MEKDKRVIYAEVPTATYERLEMLAEQAQRSKGSVIRLLIENATTDDLIPVALKTPEQGQEAAQ